MSQENPSCPIHYFIEQAKKTPDSIALIWEEKDGEYSTITYKQLLEESRNFTRKLSIFCEEKSFCKDNPIRAGIILPRQKPYIVTLLALWITGISYVPLSDTSNIKESKKRKTICERLEAIGEENTCN